tara:strand:- start:3853 stop:4119 length:267 start_codon:yes stop_codon:yes gene_type:complete
MNSFKNIFILCLIIVILLLINQNIKHRNLQFQSSTIEINKADEKTLKEDFCQDQQLEEVQVVDKDNSIIDNLINNILYKQHAFFNKQN